MKRVTRQELDRIKGRGGQVDISNKKEEKSQKPAKVILGPAGDLQDIHEALQDQGNHLEKLVDLLTKIAAKETPNALNITIEVVERDNNGHIKALHLKSQPPMIH